MSSNPIYYTYAYIRSKDSATAKAGTPYYIGKGTGDRAYVKHKGVQVPKNRRYIVVIEDNLTELGAFALERRYIRWWGRKDLGTGILLNQTDGGYGGYGISFSKETRKKLSESHVGKKLSPEHKAKIGKAHSNRVMTLEHRSKLSAASKGKPKSDDACKAMSKAKCIPVVINGIHYDSKQDAICALRIGKRTLETILSQSV